MNSTDADILRSVVQGLVLRVGRVGSELRARMRELTQQQQELAQQLQKLTQQLQELTREQQALAGQNAVLIRRQAVAPTWLFQLSTKFSVTFRVCSTCGVSKPLEEFYRRPHRNDPLRRHRQCRECMNVKMHAKIGEKAGGMYRGDADLFRPTIAAPQAPEVDG